MPRMQEVLIALGAPQADISTISVTFQRFSKVNRTLVMPQWRTEDDADDLGKGHEFATQQFKSHVEGGLITLEKYCTLEFLNYILPLLLGHTAVTTYSPLDRTTEGEELPYITYVEQMRPGAAAVRDIAMVGCAVKSLRVNIVNGPGRANCKLTVELLPSGRVVEPSAVAIPDPVVETPLNAYSLAASINGVDYAAGKSIVSIEMGWDNDLQPGFFPGSGQQNGYQVQGRMELGKRTPLFNFVARYAAGSTEPTKVRDLTADVATVALTNGTKGVTFTWQRLGFATTELAETDDKVTVSVAGKPMYTSVNGILSVVVDNT